jgi:hypothetical protein
MIFQYCSKSSQIFLLLATHCENTVGHNSSARKKFQWQILYFLHISGDSASDDEAHTGSILQSITADTTRYGLQHFLKSHVPENNKTTETKFFANRYKSYMLFLAVTVIGMCTRKMLLVIRLHFQTSGLLAEIAKCVYYLHQACLSAWTNLAPNGWIFMKFDIGDVY